MEPDGQLRSGAPFLSPQVLRRRSDRKATRSRDPQHSRRFYNQPRTARALRFSHAVLASKSSAFASCFTSRGGGPRSHSRVNSSLGPIQSAWYIGGESFLILPERTCPRSHAPVCSKKARLSR